MNIPLVNTPGELSNRHLALAEQQLLDKTEVGQPSPQQKSLPKLSDEAVSIKVGHYEHYKGLPYKILGVARHSETLDELVIYQAQYGEKKIWARPVAMFLESVMVNGKTIPRFKFIDTEDAM